MAIPLIAMGVMAVAGAAGSFMGGRARKRAARLQAAMMAQQAQMLEKIYGERAALLEKDAEDARTVAEINKNAALTDAGDVNRLAVSNAKVYEADARAAGEAAAIAAENEGIVGRRTIGTSIARYGSSGAQLAGSPLAVVQDNINLARKAVESVYREGRVQVSKLQDMGRITLMEGSQRAARFQKEAELAELMGKVTSERYMTQADMERTFGAYEANNLRHGATLTRMEGRAAFQAGIIGGIGSFAGAFAGMGSSPLGGGGGGGASANTGSGGGARRM